jgi:hypothetical protein
MTHINNHQCRVKDLPRTKSTTPAVEAWPAIYSTPFDIPNEEIPQVIHVLEKACKHSKLAVGAWPAIHALPSNIPDQEIPRVVHPFVRESPHSTPVGEAWLAIHGMLFNIPDRVIHVLERKLANTLAVGAWPAIHALPFNIPDREISRAIHAFARESPQIPL